MGILGIVYMVLAVVFGATCGLGGLYFLTDHAPAWLIFPLVVSVVVFWGCWVVCLVVQLTVTRPDSRKPASVWCWGKELQ